MFRINIDDLNSITSSNDLSIIRISSFSKNDKFDSKLSVIKK